ncbi:LAQU0S01e11848g1_1 [Lachancea quebecensis]|uniref:Alkyl transferase n=1 Tax=Lachancea quebecensis TaxID=1654605 RepID=A0A0P1KVJ5_9SACH|nr:LAQU0S01e11848g1_1 [Lachancea quebecensis]
MAENNESRSSVEVIEKGLKQTKERIKPRAPPFPNICNPVSVLEYAHAQKLRLWSFVMSLACVSWALLQIQTILTNILKVGPLPEHVSFIMDGNRRYAKSLDMPIKSGHEAGAITLLNLLAVCRALGVKTVSAYAFSIENFNRPQEEVDTLTSLLAEKLDEVARRAQDCNSELFGLRLSVVGERSRISKDLNERISSVERMTSEGDSMTLYICFPYTSRNDIYHAIYDCAEGAKYHGFPAAQIDEAFLGNHMMLRGHSNKCDLLVRTSGHTRLSDYMLWQVHQNGHVEFSSTLWPDFGFLEFFRVLLRWSFFTSIQRRRESKRLLRFHTVSRLRQTLFSQKPKHVSIEDLPAPPQAVSVAGRN